MSELKTCGLPWFNGEKKAKRPRNWNVWVDLSCKTHSSTLGWPRRHITSLRNKWVKGVPASLKSSMIILLCRADLREGTIATQLENLNVMGVIGSWVARATGRWVWLLWCTAETRKYSIVWRGQTYGTGYFNNGVVRSEIGKKPKFFLCLNWGIHLMSSYSSVSGSYASLFTPGLTPLTSQFLDLWTWSALHHWLSCFSILQTAGCGISQPRSCVSKFL